MAATTKKPVPDNLTRNEQLGLLGWIQGRAHPTRGGVDSFFLQLAQNRKLIRYHVDACLEWHRDKGIQRSNYVQACKNWIAKAAIMEEQRRGVEMPQQNTRSRSPVGFQPLSDTIEMFTKKEGE